MGAAEIEAFRHCYATHLLEAGYDIRIVQDLLGQKVVKTTMIYTYVLNHGPTNTGLNLYPYIGLNEFLHFRWLITKTLLPDLLLHGALRFAYSAVEN